MNRSVAFTFCGHATFRSLASTVSTVLVAASFVTALNDSLNAAEKPNVLFILADDLGWSDTTLYDTTTLYQTPNVERLAKRGMTFRRAYAVSPLCSPTRASILTGLHPARHGITSPVCHLPEVALQARTLPNGPSPSKVTVCKSATRLDTRYETLAETLKDAGYATGHFGKWHLGPEPYSPLQHGFDVDVPHTPTAGPPGGYFSPWKGISLEPRMSREHIEDRMADEAIKFIEKHKDRPFFLNYWQFSVHSPFQAKRPLIEKYRKRVDPNSRQRSPTYAAMVETFDAAVGKLVDALDHFNLLDNTIIFFTSDNGGNTYSHVDGVHPTSNAPLRGGKATLWEGGIRVPCVVIWPGHAEPGTISGALIQSCDFYPTILHMLGLAASENQQFDGISIVPALEGKPLPRESHYSYFPHGLPVPDGIRPAVAVHHGDWKLFRIFHNGDQGAHQWRLYDLVHDVGERNDLAAQHPDIVRELDSRIDRFLTDTDARVPTPNPDYKPRREQPRTSPEPKERRPKPPSKKISLKPIPI
jgi:arylsulfatase A-like enzyme